MKLTPLSSTTARASSEAVARGREAATAQVRRVEAMEGAEGDRQRSLQQELSEVDPRAVGPFEGHEQIIRDARQVAESLAHLDSAAALVRSVSITNFMRDQVDAKA